MADPTHIGSQLRHYRKQRGWTQTELAERTGLKRTALGAYEEGRAEPRLAALVRLAHVLDVSLDALVLGGTERRMEQDVRVLPLCQLRRLARGVRAVERRSVGKLVCAKLSKVVQKSLGERALVV